MNTLHFSAQGKILLTSEYFVLDGAQALALPTRFKQKMSIAFDDKESENPVLFWKAYDKDQSEWLNLSFKINHLNGDSQYAEEGHLLCSLLREAKKLNPNFLKIDRDIHIKTKLEFSKNWGLGSSSTLIYLISQWADVCTYELLENTLGGSGYDVACANEKGPIWYSNKNKVQHTERANFNPSFKNQLYFVYLNQKQNTRDAIKKYQTLNITHKKECIHKIETLAEDISNAPELKKFEEAILKHEDFIAENLGLETAKSLYFSDYSGAVKSLGAWGGDFVLVTSDKDQKATFDYFNQKGYKVILKYQDLILDSHDHS